MCAICVHFVILEVVILCLCFLNENMVEPVKNDAVFV